MPYTHNTAFVQHICGPQLICMHGAAMSGQDELESAGHKDETVYANTQPKATQHGMAHAAVELLQSGQCAPQL